LRLEGVGEGSRKKSEEVRLMNSKPTNIFFYPHKYLLNAIKIKNIEIYKEINK